MSLPATVRIWLCAQPTDLRKSFDSLAALVRNALGGDPLSGNVFVFRNKAADRIKLLVWEEDGYAIWYKRLETCSQRLATSGQIRQIEPALVAQLHEPAVGLGDAVAQTRATYRAELLLKPRIVQVERDGQLPVAVRDQCR